MSKKWNVVPISQIAKQVSRPENVDSLRIYRLLGAHWYAKGLYVKDEKPGTEIRASNLFAVKEGDFVYNRLFAWKGSFAVAQREHEGCFVSNEFPCFELDREQVSPKFLWLFFSRESAWLEALGLSSGSTPTSRNRLKEAQFLQMRIPLPPLDEQRRIVARIEELAALIEEARELRVKAREEAEALISSNVSSLPFDETYWGTLQNAVLDRKGTVRSGPFGSQLHHEEFVDSGVAAIGTRDVQVNHFVLNSGWYVTPEKFEQFKRYQVFPGDVLVTIVGASIGRFCVVPKDVPLAFTTKHVIAVTLDRSIAEPWFVSYMLNFHSRCRESIFSQTEGSAQPSLNSKKVCAIALPLPPPDEQRRIVAYLDDLQAQVDELTAAQDATQAELEALLPSLLDQAFRGEL